MEKFVLFSEEDVKQIKEMKKKMQDLLRPFGITKLIALLSDQVCFAYDLVPFMTKEVFLQALGDHWDKTHDVYEKKNMIEHE